MDTTIFPVKKCVRYGGMSWKQRIPGASHIFIVILQENKVIVNGEAIQYNMSRMSSVSLTE